MKPFAKLLITDIVENYYDIGAVCAINEILGGYTNRSFRIEVHQSGKVKTYFMRQYHRSKTAREVRFEHALIGHALLNGFTSAAAVVMNTKGETYVQPASSSNIFAIFKFLDGEDKYSWINPNLTDAEFQSAGRVLATFHNAVRDFDPDGLQRKEPPIMKLWPRFVDDLIGYAQPKQDEYLPADFSKHLQSILDRIVGISVDPIEVQGMPVIPIHCDYHPGNLKWSDGRVVGIFDFDWSKMDLRLFDVGLAVIYFCSRWDKGHDGELRCDKCELFLGAYQNQLRRLSGLQPLNIAEQDLMPKILGIADIYLVHWIVSAYWNMSGANDDEYLVYLKHGVRLLHWLAAHQTIVSRTIAGALS